MIRCAALRTPWWLFSGRLSPNRIPSCRGAFCSSRDRKSEPRQSVTFLLARVPEPSTITLLLAGAACLFAFAWQRAGRLKGRKGREMRLAVVVNPSSALKNQYSSGGNRPCTAKWSLRPRPTNRRNPFVFKMFHRRIVPRAANSGPRRRRRATSLKILPTFFAGPLKCNCNPAAI
jgi:hypothetical protein